jgi:hypothetical protein
MTTWLRTRFTRCYACGRLLLLHAPWQARRCDRTPLAIELPEVDAKRRRAG